MRAAGLRPPNDLLLDADAAALLALQDGIDGEPLLDQHRTRGLVDVDIATVQRVAAVEATEDLVALLALPVVVAVEVAHLGGLARREHVGEALSSLSLKRLAKGLVGGTPNDLVELFRLRAEIGRAHV